MIYIGIDPGLSGAVGVIDDTAEFPENLRVQVFDTPTVLVEGEKTKRKYLVSGMALLLKPYASRGGRSGRAGERSLDAETGGVIIVLFW